jgi:hypothetical protein
MRKLLATLALAFLLAAAGRAQDPLPELFAPEPLETAICTACGGNYTTSPGGGAYSHVGSGSSCTQAQANLTAQLRAAANDYCLAYFDYPSCSVSVVSSGGCFFILEFNQWYTSGYANFKCRYWTGGPGCIIP